MNLELPSKSFVDLNSSVIIADFHFSRFVVGLLIHSFIYLFCGCGLALAIMFKNIIKAGDCNSSQLVTLGRY